MLVPVQQDPGNTFLVVCNNATWSISELLIGYSEELKAYLPSLAQKFVELLLTKQVSLCLLPFVKINS